MGVRTMQHEGTGIEEQSRRKAMKARGCGHPASESDNQHYSART